MKEKDRLLIVEEIKDIKSLCDSLEKRIREKEMLSNNELIKRYFELEDDIAAIKEFMEKFPTESILVDSCFEYYLSNEECTHDICLYCGSYYKKSYYDDDDVDFIFGGPCYTYVSEFECSDEKDERFQFNKYHCIECNKKIEVSKEKYENFESSRTILKKRNGICSPEEYRQLLYKNTVQKTKKILTRKYGTKI